MSLNSPASGSSKKDKRPAANRRHGSDWIAKLHRRHDARRHPEQHQSLLSDDHDDHDEEPTVDHTSYPRKRRFPPGLHDAITRVKSSIQSGASVFVQGLNKSKESTRRNPKKLMLGIIGLLTASTVTLSAVLGKTLTSHQQNNVCTSSACVQVASNILRNLDSSVRGGLLMAEPLMVQNSLPDPCVDFNQYVCGGFETHHELRPEQSQVSSRSVMLDETWSWFREFLESEYFNYHEEEKQILNKIKDDYDSCMDEAKIQRLGIEPLKNIVDDIKNLVIPSRPDKILRKPYPIQNAVSRTPNGSGWLTNALFYLIKAGIEAFLSFDVKVDTRLPERHVLRVSPPKSLGLPSIEYYHDQNIINAYQKTLFEALSPFYEQYGNDSISWNRNRISPLKVIAENIIALEMKLAEMLHHTEDAQPSQTRIALSALENMFPHVSIPTIVHKLTKSEYKSDYIIVSDLHYIQGLSKVLENTPIEDIRAFLVWISIRTYASRVEHSKLRNLQVLTSQIRGAQSDPAIDRWRKCIESTAVDLPWILSRFYARDKFSSTSATLTRQIATDIKNGSAKMLEFNRLMTPRDRNKTVTKAQSIGYSIGFPTSNPDITNTRTLDEYYRDVEVTNGSYFANRIQAATEEAHRKWSRLHQSTNEPEWMLTPISTKTQYNPSSRNIEVPAAMLQEPLLYDDSIPSYISYASLGSILGNEIFKSFDIDFENEFWTNGTRSAMEKRVKCFVEQYSRYLINGFDGSIPINSRRVILTSIADIGGVKAAFETWSQHENTNPSKLLPGLERFTKSQLFWISYGNSLCSKSSKQDTMYQYLAKSKAPNSIRILGTVANSRQFRQAFNCAVKNPTCELW